MLLEIIKSTQGGVLLKILQGSKFTYKSASCGDSLQLFKASTSACGPPNSL